MRIRELAQWVVSISAPPAPARQAAAHVVVDAVASAIAGYHLPGAEAAREAAKVIWGTGKASLWFTSQKGSLATAAFANAMATSILDLDDGHRAAAGHPGAAIVPAVIAAAEVLGASGDRALAAIAIGYEAGIRIAAARDLRAIDTLITGRWAGQGVAAAIGWLRGDDVERIAEAMAIAGAVAPHMLVAEYTQVGNHTKEAIPFASANGVLADALAAKGFKGPLDILDHSSYNPHVLAHGTGREWYIETTYFKPYSCCRWIHAPIDAILALRQEIDWDKVEEIEVATFGRTLSLNNQTRPLTLQAAQYSTPFCVAASAIHGAACLQPMAEDLPGDERVLALAAKVRLTVDPDLDRLFPAGVPGRVTVRADGRSLTREVLAPKGEATNPMSWDELTEKLRTIAKSRLGARETATIVEALVGLRDRADIAPLLGCLSK